MAETKTEVKSESSIDFLLSYAIIIIVLISILSVAFLIIKTPSIYSCASPPNFNCGYVSISTSGVLTVKISQAIGSNIKINGVACADQQNATTDIPKYGNVQVNSINPSNSFYPVQLGVSGDYAPGNYINSGSSYIFYVNCYQVGGSIAKGALGSQFSGYLWLNYTIPNYGTQIERIASFTTIYSSS